MGLIEAVIERGFDMYLSAKSSAESSGGPIQDLRLGWDAHGAFGLENPGFYTLMYGEVRHGYSPEAQSRPSEILRSLADRELSVGVREGVLAAITGAGRIDDEERFGHSIIERAAAHPGIPVATEIQLPVQWIGRLGEGGNGK